MGTVQQRIDNWKLSELRWSNQVNDAVCLAWYNQWYRIFQKYLLEYIANQLQTQAIVQNIETWKSEYDLPFWESDWHDFYSIAQLRIAYKEKDWIPQYKICEELNIADYNIHPTTWNQIWWPAIYKRITKRTPRYEFISKNKVKIYPTPTEDVDNWFNMRFNFVTADITNPNTNENTLWVPRYFLDVIDDYLSYRLYQAENPELAAVYYKQFMDTLHDNIYWLNRDQRPVEEWFWNFRFFDHW